MDAEIPNGPEPTNGTVVGVAEGGRAFNAVGAVGTVASVAGVAVGVILLLGKVTEDEAGMALIAEGVENGPTIFDADFLRDV